YSSIQGMPCSHGLCRPARRASGCYRTSCRASVLVASNARVIEPECVIVAVVERFARSLERKCARANQRKKVRIHDRQPVPQPGHIANRGACTGACLTLLAGCEIAGTKLAIRIATDCEIASVATVNRNPARIGQIQTRIFRVLVHQPDEEIHKTL